MSAAVASTESSPEPGGVGHWRSEIRAQLRLAVPMTMVQLGLMTMGIVDTAMMGRASGEGLAAVAVGHMYMHLVVSLAWGTLMGLDPIVAQAFGARDHVAIARGLQRGLLIALGFSAPLMIPLLFAEPILAALGQPAAIVPTAADYCIVNIPGLAPFFIFLVLRQTLQAMGRVRVIVIVIVAANLLNVGANWALIFGHLGMPALGAVGSGLATTVCRWFMAIGLAWAAWPALAPFLRPWRSDILDPRALGRMLWVGLPIGVQFLLEVGAFSAAGFFMGSFERADYLAGHQIALNLAATTFMVPLGISAAAAVRVGHGIGSGDSSGVHRTAVVALAGGGGFMLLAAGVFTAIPRDLAALFAPNEAATLAIAALIIPVAGAFQVFDGVQVVASGLLRGAGDTRWPTLVAILGFWVLGIPLGWWLMFRAGVVPTGPWWGLALALAVVAAVLVIRVRRRLWGPLSRLQIDDP